MAPCAWLLITAGMFCVSSETQLGRISGMVVNGSAEGVPLAGAEVVLRIHDGGTIIPVADTRSDSEGRFHFDELPVDDGIQYLPGVNLDGVHFPGSRVRLDAERNGAEVQLVAYEASRGASPLVARAHEIVVQPEDGLLRVRESIRIANPSNRAYVGADVPRGRQPLTLRLSIPRDFAKVTFDKEFFGRNFQVLNETLSTGIPWPPGDRELRFTYLVPIESAQWRLRRSLDLPCQRLRVRVKSDLRDQVACSLPASDQAIAGEVVFESLNTTLAAGETIDLTLGGLAVPWTDWARYAAAAILAALVALLGWAVWCQRGSGEPPVKNHEWTAELKKGKAY